MIQKFYHIYLSQKYNHQSLQRSQLSVTSCFLPQEEASLQHILFHLLKYPSIWLMLRLIHSTLFWMPSGKGLSQVTTVKQYLSSGFVQLKLMLSMSFLPIVPFPGLSSSSPPKHAQFGAAGSLLHAMQRRPVVRGRRVRSTNTSGVMMSVAVRGGNCV